MFSAFANHASVACLKLLSLLPYRVLISIGYGLGYIAANIPSDRNRVITLVQEIPNQESSLVKTFEKFIHQFAFDEMLEFLS